MIRSALATAFVSFFFIASVVFLHSCANIIPPTGGPRDSLPPVLIKATPTDSSFHFNANKITLLFNEYVTVDNPQENVIVWPNPKTPPVIEGKLREVTIKLKDSLEKNTTYTIRFGKGLKDVNEGNADSSFNYVFTTGDKLDNNVLQGSVKLAETGKLDTTLLVVLQTNTNDTAILKNAPRYYTKLNGKGEFRFFNLPAATFNVFAVPNDYTKRYDDSTKMFAFLNKPVVVQNAATPSVILNAYQEYKETQKKPSGSTSKTTSATGNKPASRKKKASDTTIKVTADLANGRQNFLKNLELTFSDTLQSFDSSRFHFTDTDFIALPGFKIAADTSADKLIVSFPWKENTPYKLVIEKGAVKDSSGYSLAKNDTLSFYTLRESDYGSILMRFQNLDTSRHPVLELLQSEKIVQYVMLTNYEWRQKFILPGDYELRILYDTNQNGKWDAGSYAEKRQPEIVQPAKTRAGSNKITIRANWDNEQNILL